MNWIRTFSALLLSIFILSSCNEDPAPDPTSLYGKWESREYMPSMDVDWVKTYHFEPNGTFQHSIVVREPDRNDDLGYSFFRYGNYSIQNQTLQLTDLEVFISINNMEEGMYSPREELVEADFGTNSQSVNFSLQNNNSELIIKGECLIIDCEEPQDEVFIRVQ